ncbi:MAG: DUF1254 domain-containing protein [Proteobacteria bacterium]|nr:DUF1254 domain-containing protein [Pseudomonadota bacterium]
MNGWGKYVVLALIVAVATHIVVIFGTPTVLMNVALQRLGGGHYNAWHLGERVTQASRTIVRPAPDFAYSACPYDLSNGPVRIHVTPWTDYWSLSLYANNSDNFFVLDDREAQNGVEVLVMSAGAAPPDHETATIVHSPSQRGIALIRRLAPTPDTYAAAAQVSHADVCSGAH